MSEQVAFYSTGCNGSYLLSVPISILFNYQIHNNIFLRTYLIAFSWEKDRDREKKGHDIQLRMT